MTKSSNAGCYWLLGILAVGAGLLIVGNYRQSHPCDSPVTYRIGTVDRRFSVNRDLLLKAAGKAAQIWNDAAHKQLLRWDENGDLPVNLVYSEQQETATSHRAARGTAEDLRKQVSELDQQIEPLKEDFQTKKSSLDLAAHDLDTRRLRYNLRVSDMNSTGGGSQEEVRLLDTEKAYLSREEADLRAQSAQLENDKDTINALVSKRNLLVETENAQVGFINAEAGKEFLAGEYTRRGAEKAVNIFEFGNFNDLVAVLTHEFGHALTLPHNDGIHSIMAAKSDAEASGLRDKIPSLSNDDLESLKSVCRL